MNRSSKHSLHVSVLAIGLVAIAGCASSDGSRSVAAAKGRRAASLAPAPADASPRGPLATTSNEYRFAASVDDDILADRNTEIWAQVYRPTTLSAASPAPLLVFLHGNHGTCGDTGSPRSDFSCQYSSTGTCSGAYPIVTPNHLGYAYVADQLASWGYVVVSVNANRGITCSGGVPGDFGLNLARGRLILKHLQRLSEWNTTPGTTPPSLGVDLAGKLDFGNVGLMGHSRGGEGARAAYNQYRDVGSIWPGQIPDPITFQGVFEIGPVDGQTGRTLNPDGVNWAVLLPMCDGDVSNLQGIKPFDRALNINETNATNKSTFTVWGANHNYFNTQWQRSDSSGCSGPGNPPIFNTALAGSPQQQTIGLASMAAFFRGYVGVAADSSLAQLFDPQYDLTATVKATTRVDRGYTDSPSTSVSLRLDDFAALGTSAGGVTASLTGVPEHDFSLRAGAIQWSTAGAGVYYQSNFAATDLSSAAILDVRLERQPSGNPAASTDFSVALVASSGTVSAAVPISNYASLTGPAGGPFGNRHEMLQTARIPLGDFGVTDLTAIVGVRLTFNSTPSGAIYVANIRADGVTVLSGTAEPTLLASLVPNEALGDVTYGDGNAIESMRVVAGRDGQESVEVALRSGTLFEPRDELTVLKIGDREYDVTDYPNASDLHTIAFRIPVAEFSRLQTGMPMTVQYGHGLAHVRWDFGAFDSARLGK